MDPDDLTPGDLLLYRTSWSWKVWEGLLPWWIRLKTWSEVNHVETYVGGGLSFAARAEGVYLYPLRHEGLRVVLRPFTYDNASAAPWRRTVLGQKYDWKGLLVFYLAATQGAQDRMFCSEACTRDARAAGLEPFNPAYDADRVSPGMFLSSPAYWIVWTPDRKERYTQLDTGADIRGGGAA